MRILFLGLIIALAIMFLTLKSDNMPTYTDGKVQISGQLISVEIADTPAKQALGLGGRKSIREDAGML